MQIFILEYNILMKNQFLGQLEQYIEFKQNNSEDLEQIKKHPWYNLVKPPKNYPGFTLAWLDLISYHSFINNFLESKLIKENSKVFFDV